MEIKFNNNPSGKIFAARIDFSENADLRTRGIFCAETLDKLKKEIPGFKCTGSSLHYYETDEKGIRVWDVATLRVAKFMLIYYTKDQPL